LVLLKKYEIIKIFLNPTKNILNHLYPVSIQEAESLMKECASKVAGDTNMPVKMEWKRDINSLEYF